MANPTTANTGHVVSLVLNNVTTLQTYGLDSTREYQVVNTGMSTGTAASTSFVLGCTDVTVSPTAVEGDGRFFLSSGQSFTLPPNTVSVSLRCSGATNQNHLVTISPSRKLHDR